MAAIQPISIWVIKIVICSPPRKYLYISLVNLSFVGLIHQWGEPYSVRCSCRCRELSGGLGTGIKQDRQLGRGGFLEILIRLVID